VIKINRHIENRNDKRFIKQSMDRGSIEFKTRIPRQESEVLKIAGKNVVTIPSSITIIGAAKTMTRYGYRRLPVADPGSKKLEGILTSMDIVRLLGGGDSFKLIKKGHYGNFLKAINENVSQIMEKNVVFIPSDASLKEAISVMVSNKAGGIPIVDKEKKVVGIITERDILAHISELISSQVVKDVMTTEVTTISTSKSIDELTQMMVNKGFRRVPVVENGVLVGIVTATDVLRYLGGGKAFEKVVTGDIKEVIDVPVSEIMTSEVWSIGSKSKISDAAGKMDSKDIGCLPVIDNETLEGVITEHDVVSQLLEVSK